MDATTVEIGLRKPARGRWTVTPRAGVRADRQRRRSRRAGRRRRSAGECSGHGAAAPAALPDPRRQGRAMRFVEQGARTHNQLGVAARRAGSIRFTPAPVGRAPPDPGVHRARRRDGRADRRDALRRPRRRAADEAAAGACAAPGDAILLRWRRVRGATSYAVVMQLSNRKRIFRVVKRPRLTLRGFHRLARGRVSVRSLHNRRSIEPAGDRADQGRAGEAKAGPARRPARRAKDVTDACGRRPLSGACRPARGA